HRTDPATANYILRSGAGRRSNSALATSTHLVTWTLDCLRVNNDYDRTSLMPHPLSSIEDATNFDEIALSSSVSSFLVRALETEDLSAGASRHARDRLSQ